MKKSIFKTALMSAAVLSGVGLFTNTANANAAVQSSATNASQVRGVLTVVDHQKGEVHLYDRDGNIMKQTVKNGKAYKVWEKAMINGELMYRIGTDKQWIPAKYTNWDNAKVGQRVTVALPSKSAVSNRQNYAGAVRVNYQGQGKVRLLNGQGKYIPQYAAKNSTWRVWEKATINHEPMYRIGTQSQWIPAKYVAPVQTQTSAKAAPVVHANTNKQVAKPVVNPAKPAQNHTAVKPSVPATNTQVNHNTNSVKPAVPAKPAKPAVPVTPAKPSTNNQNTTKPSQPTKPAQPVTPSKPVTPTKPVQPTQPVKPTTPVQPSQPVQNKTGVNALSTQEAANIVQSRMLANGYVQGDMAGYKANEYNGVANSNTMDIPVYADDTANSMRKDINDSITQWGWDESPETLYNGQNKHTFNTAEYQNVKSDGSGTLHLTSYVY